MRDLFLFSGLLVVLLAALRKPQCGILAWLWISVMNPHRLAYGWISSFPLLDIVAAVTVTSCLVNLRNAHKSEWHLPLTFLALFYLWSCLTTIFSVDMGLSVGPWSKFSKTLLICGFMLLYMNKRHWIIASLLVFVVSISHFGIRGGLFTVITGGSYRVYGPANSSWGDNNGVSVAMLMVLPIILALRHLYTSKIVRSGILSVGILSFLSLLGTHSRGGLVGLAGQALFAVYRSNRKTLALVLLCFSMMFALIYMPDNWIQRMSTITTDEERLDDSAYNRIIQWKYAIDIANERPLFGNGFNAFYFKPYYYKHVAHLDENRAVHSNYFQVIGEQGYIGFLIYILMWVSFIVLCQKYAKKAFLYDELRWAGLMLQGIQVGLVGYAFNGLTVNMAYLDLPFFLMTIGLLLNSYVNSESARIDLYMHTPPGDPIGEALLRKDGD